MRTVFVLYLLLIFNLQSFAQTNKIHHNIEAKVYPGKSYIEATDEITVPKHLAQKTIKFKLHANLKPRLKTKGIRLIITGVNVPAKDVGMDRDDAAGKNKLHLNEYELLLKDKFEGDVTFKLVYKGNIHSPVKQSEENYQRGFSESPGIIDTMGIYLAGSTYWVPQFTGQLITFKLKTILPANWKSVSQGKRISTSDENGAHIDIWDSPEPQEEVFLIGGKFTEYQYPVGNVMAMAFLRTPDEALANKYLETTAQYLEMYRQLVGPYPYWKFALVENFWETGYGMPSFTLLGEKIIRFPFILHSSYPHELLHNWWGNSVYVDFSTGNWCEGLTAYMADHLIKEQRGQGVEYRRSTLQKFTDYVNAKNDFPLSKFRSRYNASSEAIGYGKSLMMWHMLRMKVGDDNFIKSLQHFYRNNKFKFASFNDIRQSFEEVTGENFKWFFDQWVNRKGAPQLKLGNIKVKPVRDFYDISIELNQTQKEEPFTIDVPVVILTNNGTYSETLTMRNKSEKFSVNVKSKPLQIYIDPQYDVFRKVDPNEVPPALSSAFGAGKSLIVLPSAQQNQALYQKFTASWTKNKEDKFEIVNDNEVDKLPTEKTVWILGFENKFRPEFSALMKKYNSSLSNDFFQSGKKKIAKDGNSVIISVRNPVKPKEVFVFLAIGNENAIPGLVRKLPHYGKYSYLAFEGDEPTNIAKGQWDVINSPLVKTLDPSARNLKPRFKKRKALATLAPAFSAKRMMKHVEYLASRKMKGRGLGTKELEEAAGYIAEQFKQAGLIPAGDDKSYFQNFIHKFKDKGKIKIKNIIGIIPGNDPELKNTYVVVSAHYDHLGLGWPDVRKGNKGKIHFGADDNASGVAVLLELAKAMGKTSKPKRTIVFAAFSAEEAGLLGSKYFVKHFPATPDNTIANINLDTVGRLEGKKILILNGNTAREWKFIFMGTDFVTGIGTDLVSQQLDASDQVSFIRNGIPAVQFFSGPNADYHRPTDTADKIDADGMVKVATVAKEVINYLADRKELLNFRGEKKTANKQKQSGDRIKTVRRASTGTIPDFAYNGKGVKIGGTVPDSPAEKAGLKKGDVIKKFDGEEVNNLRDYSNLLKQHKPGDKVVITIDRNGKTVKVELTLGER